MPAATAKVRLATTSNAVDPNPPNPFLRAANIMSTDSFQLDPSFFQGNNADWVSDFLAAAGQPRLAVGDPRIVRDDYTMPDWCFIDDADPDWDSACEQRNNSKYGQLDAHVVWLISDVWSLS